MKRKILAFIFSTLILFSVVGQTRLTKEQEQAVAMLNYIQYSVYKIKTHNNIVLLEEEYKILKNMNLEIIEDESSVQQINYAMNVANENIINDISLARLKKSIERRMSKVVYQTIPNVTTLFYGKIDPFALALNAVRTAANAYMSYEQTKNQLSEEYDEKVWEIEKNTMEQLDNMYQSMNTYTFNLIHEHDLKDEWRITEEQIAPIFRYLKDDNLERRYSNLKDLQEKKFYDHFSVYWYYMAIAAADAGYEDEALVYYNKFENENVPIFRTDYNAIDAYKGKIAILIKDINKNKKEILDKLHYIDINTNDNDENAWKNYYFCALVYSKLGNKKKAEQLLDKNIRMLTQRVENKIVDYSRLSDCFSTISKYGDDVETEINVGISGYDGLELSRKLLKELNKDVADESIIRQYKNDSADYNEFINYFGLQKLDNVVNNSIDSLKAIKTDCSIKSSSKVDVNCVLDPMWMLNPTTEIAAVFIDSNNKETEYKLYLDEKECRKLIKKRDNELLAYTSGSLDIDWDKNDIVFKSIKLKSPTNCIELKYDLKKGKSKKNIEAQSVVINGISYDLVEKDAGLGKIKEDEPGFLDKVKNVPSQVGGFIKNIFN